MSIFNPAIKTQELPASTVWATLKSTDGKYIFNFLVNPETITYSHTSNHTSLNVLRSEQPLTSFTGSTSVLSIPKIYLWTLNSRSAIDTHMAMLKSMTKPTSKGGNPPLLNFTWGMTVEPRVYLTSVDFNITQWRSGIPTQAEGSMSFLISPEWSKQSGVVSSTPKPTIREASNPKVDIKKTKVDVKKPTDTRRRPTTEPVPKRDAAWKKANGK